MTKNELTFSSSSILHITSKSSSPVSKKLTNFPLPPKKAEVVQKLQPIGHPTEGIIVAAVAPLRSGRRMPMMRVRMPETISGWLNRGGLVFAEIAAHPSDTLAPHDVIGVDHLFDTWDRGDVSADDDGRLRRELADHAAHLTDFADVHDDRRDAHDVVLVGRQFLAKPLSCGEVEDRTGR